MYRQLNRRHITHAILDREIAEWRAWSGELAEIGKPNFGEMTSRLSCFRELLSNHFTEEENGVFLSLVMQAEPDTTDTIARIAELQDEHRRFLRDIDRLHERLGDQKDGIEGWGAARDEFEEFLNRLITLDDLPHEVSEASPGDERSLASGDTRRQDAIERAHIIEVLRQEKGSKAKAARTLGIHRRKLYRLLERFDIDEKVYR